MSDRRILISHAHQDQEAAALIADCISRVTLNQLEVWFSSDASAAGGVRPGESWMSALVDRLRERQCVIALVTPRSVAQPWLYFESGHVAGREGGEVIPVAVGLGGVAGVPFPLAMFQSYHVADVTGATTFLRKLVAKYGIRWDDAMGRVVVESLVSGLARLSFDLPAAAPNHSASSTAQVPVEELKEHIDRRFFELADAWQAEAKRRSSSADDEQPLARSQYTLPLHIRFPDHEAKGRIQRLEHLVILPHSTTAQDVLNTVFFMLDGLVRPYRYLQDWILLGNAWRPSTPYPVDPLVISGRDNPFPARFVFPPGSRWEAVPLLRPFRAGEPPAFPEGLPAPLPAWTGVDAVSPAGRPKSPRPPPMPALAGARGSAAPKPLDEEVRNDEPTVVYGVKETLADR